MSRDTHMELRRLARRTDPATEYMNTFNAHMVTEVEKAIAMHPVVVVGMKQNPVVRKVRKVLTDAGQTFEYLEYGSYLSRWKERLAIKIWSAWPTFPQVFVRGVLIGGCHETERMLKDGTFSKMLAQA